MPLPALLAAATTLLPGLWEYQTSLGGMGGKSEQKCLSKAEIDKFLTDPSNRHYDCDYTTREVGAGRVRLEGVCTNRKHAEQKVGVSLKGAYTPTTIRMKGVAKPRIVGLELPLSASVTAERISAVCTPETPPPT